MDIQIDLLVSISICTVHLVENL